MDKIVEAVARAMEKTAARNDKPWFLANSSTRTEMVARAAILATLKAIEEPSEEMLEAADGYCSSDAILAKCWKAMLQALSKSIEGGNE